MTFPTSARALCALLLTAGVAACAPDTDEDDVDTSIETIRTDTVAMMPQTGTLAEPQIVRATMTVNAADSTAGAIQGQLGQGTMRGADTTTTRNRERD